MGKPTPTTSQLLTKLYGSFKPGIFRLDAEGMHDRAINALSTISLQSHLKTLIDESDVTLTDYQLHTHIPGIGSGFPVGVAAGFDKNGVAFPALLALGFGTVEIGTVTPIPQAGNPKPRVFRLPQDQALINRMGFPGAGSEEVVVNLQKRRRSEMRVGINIGPNKTAVEAGRAIEDVLIAYRRLAPYASYVCINVSSPNTAGLRSLQARKPLQEMLASVKAERSRRIAPPIFAKISPDLDDHQLADAVEAVVAAGVDGIIATNTTICRPPGLKSTNSCELGGLSGRPLAPISQQTLRRLTGMLNGDLPVIAVGGISTGEDVINAIASGAAATQLYTSFIYRGPLVAIDIASEMRASLQRLGVSSVQEIQGNWRDLV